MRKHSRAPAREEIHRLLMCSYAEMGNRPKAIKQSRKKILTDVAQ